MAIGGNNGLLHIVDLDDYQFSETHNEEIINYENIHNIHILDGHSGSVSHLVWNDNFQKLASSDCDGLTIVWSMHEEEGMWCQDMVNNQNHSYVTDMKWSNDGELIGIVYQNGTVIVGSVEGNKLWGLELDVSLRCVEWSPRTNCIVLVTDQSLLKVYDKIGNHIRDVESCLSDIRNIHWSPTKDDQNTILKVAIYDANGQMNLVSTIYKAKSQETFVESFVEEGVCRWSPNGNILAVCGRSGNDTETSFKNLVIKFYDSDGKYLYRHDFSNNESAIGIEWQCSSLRIAIATESSIHFLHIRPDNAWTTLNSNSVLVYKSSLVSDTVLQQQLTI